jgi:carboxypeptidase PM20D1
LGIEQQEAAGFSDDDIQLIPIDADGEPTAALVVRYKGDGSSGKKALGLMAHMDVVDALPKDWVKNPFELIEEDGTFYGRGTIDNKHGVVLLTSTFQRLKREGFVPSRDMVLLFTGDEETGMVTTRYLAKTMPEKMNLGFILNSDAGGGSLNEKNEAVMYMLQAAEKTFVTLR